ncbi:MAG: exodeoxyribonuclease VII large subunit [Treponema sp.]|nr:exodeoxyribonuclease VII large subunit [Treponema sp.]MDY2925369.1 exodeoxyribonuclease VII large subunit [Treponema sp.]
MSDFFDSNAVFTVSSLTNLIKNVVENISPQSVQLEGEISNYRPSTSGHVYFTLKDSGAQISAVLFRSSAARLDFLPKDGMKVLCTGKLTVYAARGNYQIVVSSMKISGTGNILQMIEERKKRFAAEGLFDRNRKKPLPMFPQKVGIVTSPTGAALRDILQISRRRNNSVSIIIFPALVQGETAPASIAEQIETANKFKMCDILIVGRGGGSLEDLLPFSDEKVVRAVANSEIPVVSAVGHEIDWALSDFAADERAPTPSAAAELVFPQKSDILNSIEGYKSEMIFALKSKVEHIKVLLKAYSRENLELQFRNIEQPLLSRFENAKAALAENILRKISDARLFIGRCVEILEASSPQAIFSRGYAMVRDKESGKIIRSGKDTAPGKEIEILPASGKLTATVNFIADE